MLRMLIATDGSDNAARAVRHVVELAERGVPVEAVLLNVQPPVLSGEVSNVAPIEIAERKRTVAAETATAAGRAPLEAAGIPVTVRDARSPADDQPNRRSPAATDVWVQRTMSGKLSPDMDPALCKSEVSFSGPLV